MGSYWIYPRSSLYLLIGSQQGFTENLYKIMNKNFYNYVNNNLEEWEKEILRVMLVYI